VDLPAAASGTARASTRSRRQREKRGRTLVDNQGATADLTTHGILACSAALKGLQDVDHQSHEFWWGTSPPEAEANGMLRCPPRFPARPSTAPSSPGMPFVCLARILQVLACRSFSASASHLRSPPFFSFSHFFPPSLHFLPTPPPTHHSLFHSPILAIIVLANHIERPRLTPIAHHSRPHQTPTRITSTSPPTHRTVDNPSFLYSIGALSIFIWPIAFSHPRPRLRPALSSLPYLRRDSCTALTRP
jgi:hypothetical protein